MVELTCLRLADGDCGKWPSVAPRIGTRVLNGQEPDLLGATGIYGRPCLAQVRSCHISTAPFSGHDGEHGRNNGSEHVGARAENNARFDALSFTHSNPETS